VIISPDRTCHRGRRDPVPWFMIAASTGSATFEYDGIESAADHDERIMPADCICNCASDRAAGNYGASACIPSILCWRYDEKYPRYLSCRSRRRQSCPSMIRRQEAVLQLQGICPS